MKPSLCLPAIKEPYVLADQAAEMLSVAAKEDCKRCQHTGVSAWKNKGRYPVVCRCARDSWRGEAEYVQAHLKMQIEQAMRGEGVVPETPVESPSPESAPAIL